LSPRTIRNSYFCAMQQNITLHLNMPWDLALYHL